MKHREATSLAPDHMAYWWGESSDLNAGSSSLEFTLISTVYHMEYMCYLSGV